VFAARGKTRSPSRHTSRSWVFDLFAHWITESLVTYTMRGSEEAQVHARMPTPGVMHVVAHGVGVAQVRVNVLVADVADAAVAGIDDGAQPAPVVVTGVVSGSGCGRWTGVHRLRLPCPASGWWLDL